jgi:hypothetical protein
LLPASKENHTSNLYVSILDLFLSLPICVQNSSLFNDFFNNPQWGETWRSCWCLKMRESWLLVLNWVKRKRGTGVGFGF